MRIFKCVVFLHFCCIAVLIFPTINLLGSRKMRVSYSDRPVCPCVFVCVFACVRPVKKKWLSHFPVHGCDTFTILAPTVHFDMIYWYHVVVCVLGLLFTLEWPRLGRNGSVYITVPMGATSTKLAPTVHLDMIYWCHVVVCVLDLHFTLESPL